DHGLPAERRPGTGRLFPVPAVAPGIAAAGAPARLPPLRRPGTGSLFPVRVALRRALCDPPRRGGGAAAARSPWPRGAPRLAAPWVVSCGGRGLAGSARTAGTLGGNIPHESRTASVAVPPVCSRPGVPPWPCARSASRASTRCTARSRLEDASRGLTPPLP